DRLNTRWTEPPPPDHPPIFIPLPGNTTITRQSISAKDDHRHHLTRHRHPRLPLLRQDHARTKTLHHRAEDVHHWAEHLITPGRSSPSSPSRYAGLSLRAVHLHDAGPSTSRLSIDAVLRTLFTRSCAAGLTHQARTPS
ncbi:hypothetical protein Dimus_013376, partial [Dionaea muscipula]